MSGKREYGDYQTPSFFAQKVCSYLHRSKKLDPTTIIEPTCGIGNFLEQSLIFDAQDYIGIEINDEYCEVCKEKIRDPRVKIIHENFFCVNPKQLVEKPGDVLIIGNPPWVTSSTLSSLRSENLPQKSNLKGFKGIDAITGASNFDICEYIILQLIEAFQNTNTAIAMLCKTSVARNVFTELIRRRISYSECEIVEFDAEQVFHIGASACLLFIHLSLINTDIYTCSVRNMDAVQNVQYSISCKNGKLQRIENQGIDDFDGKCCFEWRQGVKHDCSKVMELTEIDGELYNARHEHVDIERDIVFPLVKSSMFKQPIKTDFSKHVIVTQTMTNESTYKLAKSVPKTWAYLENNIELFEQRKSSVYRNAPPFSMFGVGRYSFSPYKVGVSGFNKHAIFSLLYTKDKRPVMTDDTSYFLCFETYEMAYIAMLILNNIHVQNFLRKITFLDAKRPYTKKTLQRIDFHKIISFISFAEIKQTEHDLELSDYAKDQMYHMFKEMVRNKTNSTFEQQLSIFAIS